MKYLVVPLLVITVSGLALIKSYWDGHKSGAAEERAKVHEAVLKEVQRQQEANNMALTEARLRADQLATERNDLESRLEANLAAAQRDPQRDACGLSPDSVRRIDSIR
jgi:hypothetical protein